jgi:UDP-N-acetylglucosamine 2-epimerase (non-hydrolysing)
VKILTVLGTRPEIIRLSGVIRLLDQYCSHTLVHTGQNFDDRLSAVFFEQLNVRQPDVFLNVRGENFAAQIGQIIEKIYDVFERHRPDRLLILGDTNSGLTAIVARRLGIPVYHMEAGNRCFDDRVPEEVNRRAIDHSSTVLMPYTQRSRENLMAEGFATHRVYVTGNPIKQVIDEFADPINKSAVLEDLELEPEKFFLVTAHRAENVDKPDRLRDLISGLTKLHERYGLPVIISFHPRTRSKAEQFGINLKSGGLRFLEPLGFFDFIKLEKNAFCTLTDSGTVQEEACIFGVANVTMRDVTERPETVDCGSNILSGTEPENILNAVRIMTSRKRNWSPPPEYLAPLVAETVCNILLSKRLPDAAEVDWRARAGALAARN